jgi:hypothetical protein
VSKDFRVDEYTLQGAPSKLSFGGDFLVGDADPQSWKFRSFAPLQPRFILLLKKIPAQAKLGRGTLEIRLILKQLRNTI